MADVVGFAFLGFVGDGSRKTSFPSMSSPPTPNAILCMTTTAGMVQKAAGGRKKKSAFGGKKTADCRPLPDPPQGAGIRSRCVLGLYGYTPFLGKDWDRAFIWAFSLPRGEG